jgi:hypothetical protein
MNKQRTLRLRLSRTTLRDLDSPDDLQQVVGGRINDGGPRPNVSCAVQDCGTSLPTSGGVGSIVLC